MKQAAEWARRRGVPLVGVESLGNGYKPDALVLKGADVVQAVHKGPPETVQLPDQQAGEFPCPGVGHELVQPWSAGLGAAGHAW